MEQTYKKWKIIKSDYLIQRPWLTARRDKVELADGRINDEYYVLEYPDWVNVIAITQNGQFIMERQYRHGMQVMSTEIPCGVMEKGETPIEAAQRELLEETGYAGGDWTHLMDIGANPGSQSNLTHCFLAKGVKKVAEQKLDATEELSVFLLSEEEVRKLLLEGKLCQALMVAPLYKYFYDILSHTVAE